MNEVNNKSHLLMHTISFDPHDNMWIYSNHPYYRWGSQNLLVVTQLIISKAVIEIEADLIFMI